MTTQWVDPPPSHRRADGWFVRLEPVMEQPGQWALVSEFSASSSAYCAARDLRNGRTHKPAGQWEFRAARSKRGQFGVWAKFLGMVGT